MEASNINRAGEVSHQDLKSCLKQSPEVEAVRLPGAWRGLREPGGVAEGVRDGGRRQEQGRGDTAGCAAPRTTVAPVTGAGGMAGGMEGRRDGCKGCGGGPCGAGGDSWGVRGRGGTRHEQDGGLPVIVSLLRAARSLACGPVHERV